MQFGIPITTTNGGIKAVSRVILYPNKTIVPKLQITPIPTTRRLMSVVLNDQKNKNKVITESTSDPIKNQFISALILLPMIVRI